MTDHEEWKCKAQRTADPPQDCDWPVCGCDPYADKVIATLQEAGHLPEKCVDHPTAKHDWVCETCAEITDPAASAGSTPAREEQQAERFKDALQAAFNAGAFICPLAGRDDKPENHARYCQACRVRGWLTSGWYLRPDADKPKVGEELVTALKEYGTHHKSCPIASNWKRKGQDGNWYPVPCNCGFAAVLATYDPPSGSAAPAQET
jgi:hypothetical protein